MELKTKVVADDGRQDLQIIRDFELSPDLLFRAYTEPGLLEEWMGTKVLLFEPKKQGAWRFETTNAAGAKVFAANGVHHEFIANEKITRTFEMENASFGVQLEILQFESLSDETSRLTIHSIYESSALRDQMLGIGLGKGVNWAHNRLEEVAKKSKK